MLNTSGYAIAFGEFCEETNLEELPWLRFLFVNFAGQHENKWNALSTGRGATFGIQNFVAFPFAVLQKLQHPHVTNDLDPPGRDHIDREIKRPHRSMFCSWLSVLFQKKPRNSIFVDLQRSLYFNSKLLCCWRYCILRNT